MYMANFVMEGLSLSSIAIWWPYCEVSWWACSSYSKEFSLV